MKTRIIFLIGSVLLLMGSCTKRIELDLNNEEFQRLVVEGWITDQTKAHQVRLSWTSSYFENQPAPTASGATVTISDGVNTHVLTEQPVGSGYYYTDPSVAGTVGSEHTLTVELNGETWTASDLMNPVAQLDSVALEFNPSVTTTFGEEDAYYGVLMWFQETPGVGDFYRWRTLVNGQSSSDTLSEASFVDDVLYDGTYVSGIEVDYVDSAAVQSGDVITLEQHAISEAAYDVIIAVLTETDWRGGLFDAAPANVPSNISNGALGYFGAAAVSEKSVVVP